jgi:DNA-binding FadR family transcriptional regulator
VTAPLTRAQAVADRLRQEILRGNFRAGERLPAERELAARLGVNRGAVREALGKLEQLGLVEIRQGGGTTVRPLGEASVEVVRHLLFVEGRVNPVLAAQICDVQEMLIAGAARLAVERGSDDALLRARDLVRRLGRPSTTEDELAEILERLMAIVTEQSGNLVIQLLRNTLRLVLAQLGPHRRFFRPSRDAMRPAVDALVRAVEQRDRAAAEETVRALLRAGRERLLRALAENDSTAPDHPSEEKDGDRAA